jgi:hypothetical protein
LDKEKRGAAMGLNIYIENEGTEVWRGAYSAFMRFRIYIARMAGFHLPSMWGFAQSKKHDGNPPWMCPFQYDHSEPKGWLEKHEHMPMKEDYEPIPFPPKEEESLVILLDHSDCDGEIEVEDLKPLTIRLTQLYNRMPEEDLGGHIGDIKEKTRKFIDGLNKAILLQKRLIFR